jgi:hypothetical protein
MTESSGVSPESGEVKPESRAVWPESRDVPAESRDVPPESRDVPPESRDVPPAEAGPSWRPPRDRETNLASIVVGLLLLAVGAWYLLDHTLDIEMPRIDWGDFWPVILIAIGGVVIYQSIRSRT